MLAVPGGTAALLGTSSSRGLRRVAEKLRAFATKFGSVRTLSHSSSRDARCPVPHLRFESLRAVRRGFGEGFERRFYLRRGRDSNPSGSVGNNLRRHATLHTNARKFGSKWFGSLPPLVPVSRRQSSAVRPSLGSGWAAMSRSHATQWRAYGSQSAGHGGPAHKIATSERAKPDETRYGRRYAGAESPRPERPFRDRRAH